MPLKKVPAGASPASPVTMAEETEAVPVPEWLRGFIAEAASFVGAIYPLGWGVDEEDGLWAVTLHPSGVVFAEDSSDGFEGGLEVDVMSIGALFEELESVTSGPDGVTLGGVVGGEDVILSVMFEPPDGVEPSVLVRADGSWVDLAERSEEVN